MLYLAAAEGTALAEISTGAEPYHVAGLKMKIGLKILDLSIKQEADTDAESLIQCIARSSLCAAPRVGEGWVKPEYVFTRFVADCALHAGFDAIRYGSTKDRNGSNIVLLNPTQDIGTIAELHSVRTTS
jgi:hypothetical protein